MFRSTYVSTFFKIEEEATFLNVPRMYVMQILVLKYVNYETSKAKVQDKIHLFEKHFFALRGINCDMSQKCT